jgi:hypothetical protein
MKYLVLILAVFLLLDSPTLAQETEIVTVTKPLICGPKEMILDGVKNFGETPLSAWIDSDTGSPVMLYINSETGTTTVVMLGEIYSCILSQGYGGAFINPAGEKIKGMPIKHLTF